MDATVRFGKPLPGRHAGRCRNGGRVTGGWEPIDAVGEAYGLTREQILNALRSEGTDDEAG